MSAPHQSAARVHEVRVTPSAVHVRTEDEVILDVCFDGRRVWSFWVMRDARPDADGQGWTAPWPSSLHRYLDGRARITVRAHVSGAELFDEELSFGSGAGRIAVVDAEGRPLGIDKSGRLALTFDTRTPDQVAPLLDSIGEVLAALRAAGADAFLAYGTLLGAVREGALIGHDSDADLGYVSRFTHPADVVAESFRLQRRLVAMGYAISRYSGAAFKVDVLEADGSVRGLDVFGGFLWDGHLHLMGEIRTPFRAEWVHPLGTATLEGRTFPVPADTDRFLAATYGPSWRVPDPAYVFETPESTHRRLNGWFRGIRVKRQEWERTWSGERLAEPALEPTDFARWVYAEEPALDHILDVGCGRGVDAYWFATQGVQTHGLDFVPRAAARLAARAASEGVPAEFGSFNLLELRSVLGYGARAARLEGRRAVTARHVADATDAWGRRNLWRYASMALHEGGNLYLEFLVQPGGDGRGREHLRTLPVGLVVEELEACGARIRHHEVLEVPPVDASGQPRRTGRLVATWER